jgi:hypothetical protein
MKAIEQESLEALRALEGAANAVKQEGTRVPIRPILERLDELAAQLPPETPGDLRHYLQRKSYEKARLFLEGRGSEATPGNCGR